MSPWNDPLFDEIDHIVKRPSGEVYLLSQKAGRWTIQLTMAVQLNRSFAKLVEMRAAGKIQFTKIVVGVFYGKTHTLTDKYDLIRGINRGARHEVKNLAKEVEVYAGRDFWTWLNDGEAQTQEWVMLGILLGIELGL